MPSLSAASKIIRTCLNFALLGGEKQNAKIGLETKEGIATEPFDTRQRLVGQICYQCKALLPSPHHPGEHLCARCDAVDRAFFSGPANPCSER